MFKLFTVISIGMYVVPSSLPPLLKDIIQGEEMLAPIMLAVGGGAPKTTGLLRLYAFFN